MVGSFHDDPVYNDTVAWPDDAKIIRARDLGPEKDRDIFRYYAQRQPARVFYIYDPDARAAGRYPLTCPSAPHADLAPCHGNNPFSRHASATRLIAIVYAAVR